MTAKSRAGVVLFVSDFRHSPVDGARRGPADLPQRHDDVHERDLWFADTNKTARKAAARYRRFVETSFRFFRVRQIRTM